MLVDPHQLARPNTYATTNLALRYRVDASCQHPLGPPGAREGSNNWGESADFPKPGEPSSAPSSEPCRAGSRWATQEIEKVTPVTRLLLCSSRPIRPGLSQESAEVCRVFGRSLISRVPRGTTGAAGIHRRRNGRVQQGARGAARAGRPGTRGAADAGGLGRAV